MNKIQILSKNEGHTIQKISTIFLFVSSETGIVHTKTTFNRHAHIVLFMIKKNEVLTLLTAHQAMDSKE